jgi:hypothetical protein
MQTIKGVGIFATTVEQLNLFVLAFNLQDATSERACFG